MSKLHLLQCRIAKDGSDHDLEEIFSDEEIEKSDVSTRSDRMKSLMRKGLRYERLELHRKTPTYSQSGSRNTVMAKIGSEVMKLKLN